MKANFNDCVKMVLASEGGYTNDPRDPGGPTNFGITIYDYRKYISSKGNADDVRLMSKDQAIKIYKEKYWDALNCDTLPSGVDYTCFDYGVNSGLGRPRSDLKKFYDKYGHALIDAINDERMAYLQKLKTFVHFGKGWTRRVAAVRAKSHEMYTEFSTPTPMAAPVAGGAVAAGGTAVAASHWTAHQPEIIIGGLVLAFVIGTVIYLIKRK